MRTKELVKDEAKGINRCNCGIECLGSIARKIIGIQDLIAVLAKQSMVSLDDDDGRGGRAR
jgi:hypothetical protein